MFDRLAVTLTASFLPRDAVLMRYTSVRPSVCLSHAGTATKSNVAQSMPFGSEIICVTVHWVQTTPVGIRRKHVGA